MGCRQSTVRPADPVNKHRLEKTESQVDIIQNTSDKSERHSIVDFRNSPTISNPLIIPSIISNKSDRLTSHPTPLNSIDTWISRDNIFKSPTIYSDIPDDSSISIASNESDSSYSIYRPEISSLANSEKLAYGQNAIIRFISARPNRISINRESTHLRNWSEPDESYSIRDSIISRRSADSEGSVLDIPRGPKTIFVQPKKSNLRQQTFSNATSSDSDDSDLHYVTSGNSTYKDVEIMRKRLETTLSWVSTKLSNRDIHSRGRLSETTSETDEG
jgi:hypothetical protein